MGMWTGSLGNSIFARRALAFSGSAGFSSSMFSVQKYSLFLIPFSFYFEALNHILQIIFSEIFTKMFFFPNFTTWSQPVGKIELATSTIVRSFLYLSPHVT